MVMKNATKRSETRKKCRAVLVRLEHEEAARLTEVARSAGISIQELLRRGSADRNVKPRRPSAGAGSRLSEGDRAVAASLTASIARTNGGVVQLAKAVRIEGITPQLHAKIESILGELRDIQRRCDVLLRGGDR